VGLCPYTPAPTPSAATRAAYVFPHTTPPLAYDSPVSNRPPKVKQVRAPFEAMDSVAANGQCSNRTGRHTTSCKACTMRVVLHCDGCKIQITGCLCTEYKRFGNDEAWKRAVARWGETAARQRAEQAGLWVPPQR
jgi:hypothetical protein